MDVKRKASACSVGKMIGRKLMEEKRASNLRPNYWRAEVPCWSNRVRRLVWPNDAEPLQNWNLRCFRRFRHYYYATIRTAATLLFIENHLHKSCN